MGEEREKAQVSRRCHPGGVTQVSCILHNQVECNTYNNKNTRRAASLRRGLLIVPSRSYQPQYLPDFGVYWLPWKPLLFRFFCFTDGRRDVRRMIWLSKWPAELVKKSSYGWLLLLAAKLARFWRLAALLKSLILILPFLLHMDGGIIGGWSHIWNSNRSRLTFYWCITRKLLNTHLF